VVYSLVLASFQSSFFFYHTVFNPRLGRGLKNVMCRRTVEKKKRRGKTWLLEETETAAEETPSKKVTEGLKDLSK